MARPRCRHVCTSGLLLFIIVAALIKLFFFWVVRRYFERLACETKHTSLSFKAL